MIARALGGRLAVALLPAAVVGATGFAPLAEVR